MGKVKFCKRCVTPENTRPILKINPETGICAACEYQEAKGRIDWSARWQELVDLAEEVKARAKERGAAFDVLIPVSGGKDSHFQVWTALQLGLKPLLCWFNHGYNSVIGLRNLRNLVKKSGCPLVHYDTPSATARKLSRWAILYPRILDPTFFYHSGIMTYPIRVAVEKKIPFMLWGEEGFSESCGLLTLQYRQEFTRWKRTEFSMRGVDTLEILEDEAAQREGITREDLTPYFYPSDDEIGSLDLQGLYLGNFTPWDALAQTRLMVKEWDFMPYDQQRERTFSLAAKVDDHANPVHEWIRYLRWGYGRATDDACTEIRLGRMSREEGISMVTLYDHQKPVANLQYYLDFLGLTEEQVLEAVDPKRDPRAWQKDEYGWRLMDHVLNHVDDEGVEAARLPQKEGTERTFHPANARYYWGGIPKFPAQLMPGPLWTL